MQWAPGVASKLKLTRLQTMEDVWAYLRANKLCARVWDTYDDIVEARRSAWMFLINNPDRIRSIGDREWAKVNR